MLYMALKTLSLNTQNKRSYSKWRCLKIGETLTHQAKLTFDVEHRLVNTVQGSVKSSKPAINYTGVAQALEKTNIALKDILKKVKIFKKAKTCVRELRRLFTLYLHKAEKSFAPRWQMTHFQVLSVFQDGGHGVFWCMQDTEITWLLWVGIRKNKWYQSINPCLYQNTSGGLTRYCSTLYW